MPIAPARSPQPPARPRLANPLALGALLVLAAGCGPDQAPPAAPDAPPANGLAAAIVRPADPGAGDVRFTIDGTRTKLISRYIYGVNALTDGDGAPADAFPWHGATPPSGVALNRMGGNRLSAYNWENNFSNAGRDYGPYSNDAFLSSSRTPGEAVRARTAATFARGAAMLVTIPMLGYVAADGNGPTGADESGLKARLASRFVVSRARKGAPFAAAPSLTDGAVYQDEFVAWINRTFPGAVTSTTRPIFFSLDNEPDIWHSTHEEVRSKVNGQDRLLTYDDLVRTTVEYAAAIKAVAPGAKVFGPAVATWAGAATLGRWPSPDPDAGTTFFLDYYLARLRDAERAHGRRLVDVLDLHWYPAAGASYNEITNDYATQSEAMIQARLQAPRSLWDPTYNEGSWVNDVQGGPIRLLPLLRDKIAAHYPGTKIAITEYYYGRGGDISGGIAQADVLGIFGREGIFAASLWPYAGVWAQPYGGDGRKAYAYVFGAFKMFRDFNGRGAQFGKLGASAATSDAARSSVYAGIANAGSRSRRVTVIAINKTNAPLTAAVLVTDIRRLTRAEVYTLTAASPNPVRQRDLAITRRNAFTYTMPPMSVSTLALYP